MWRLTSACVLRNLEYEDLKKPDRFRSQFYDVPHSFTEPMQAEAFDWLDHWLKDA